MNDIDHKIRQALRYEERTLFNQFGDGGLNKHGATSSGSETKHPDSEHAALLSTLKGMPCEHHQVIRLFYLEQFGLQDIVLLLGLPEGTVKLRLFKARQNFKQTLSNN